MAEMVQPGEFPAAEVDVVEILELKLRIED